jgi:hypothetical protein
MKHRSRIPLAAVMIALTALAACSTDSTSINTGNGEPIVTITDTTIVRTDTSGTLLTDNTSQWMPRWGGTISTLTQIYPIFPNPVRGFTQLFVMVRNSTFLTVRVDGKAVVPTFFMPTGSQSWNLDLTKFSKGFHKMTLLAGSDSLSMTEQSYGIVKIEK